MSGAASSIGQIAAVSAIGDAPEDNALLNDFTPSSNALAAWWRFETVSAIQIFSGVADSILDSTGWGHHGTPSGFQGSDVISSETTIINGASASGDLQSILGGSLDHGGLNVLDPQDGTVKLEMGSENLIFVDYNNWVTTGGGVSITIDANNVFYGSSGIRVNTISGDSGAVIDISNSALLFAGNTYTCSLRFRSISGSTSARINFKIGSSLSSITATTDTSNWKPIILRNTATGVASGSIEVLTLASASVSSSLFHIDGLQVIEGDYPAAFIGPERIRKSGQLSWPVGDN